MLNLVTGGCGFIGHHIASRLAAMGEDVRILDITQPSRPIENVYYQLGSITDPQAVESALTNVDTVFHVAANPYLWAKDKEVFDQINHLGTKEMLEGAMSVGVKRFVHTSSHTISVGRTSPRRQHSVYDTTIAPLTEQLGPYPRSKWQAEAAVRDAVASGLDAVIVVPTMPIGPGDLSHTGPTKMIIDYVNGKTPAVLQTRMNFIDVRDLAQAHIDARDNGATGERYLACAENLWLSEFLETLGRVTGRKMPTAQVPYPLALLAAYVDEFISDTLSGKPPTAPVTGVRLAGRPADYIRTKTNSSIQNRLRPLEDSLRDQWEWFQETGLIETN